MAKREGEPKLFGTKQVAKFLDIPEWRVKNFSEGEAYRLPPSVRIGTGRGSRRLYNVADIFRMAVANELINYGFTPETIGEAVREIPESMLIYWQEVVDYQREPLETVPVLAFSGGRWGWRVRKSHEIRPIVSEALKEDGKTRGFFFVNLISLFREVLARITQEMPETKRESE